MDLIHDRHTDYFNVSRLQQRFRRDFSIKHSLL